MTPYSVWLPGLFNPTSYLTAVMQVTARRTGLPLDQMTTETHGLLIRSHFLYLTNLLCLFIVTTFLKHDAIDYYPTDGAFIHGLYIEGARWPTGDEAGEPEMLTGTPVAGTLGDEILFNTICSVIIVNFGM